eukprot:m.124497 g.124497  ORF g.124497 m.124497 type:complete len:337 (+) comp13503_c0_seq1:133-1143(+)
MASVGGTTEDASASGDQEGWQFPGASLVATVVWRKILKEHPSLVDLFVNSNPDHIRDARGRFPELDSTLDEHHQFFGDGYIHLKGAVPMEQVNNALRHINACIGRGDLDRTIPDPTMVGLPSNHASSPAITDLFNDSKSRLPTVVQDLLGRGNLDPSSTMHAQVALRFPSAAVKASEVAARSAQALKDGKGWHIDGFGDGHHSAFALLVGVCLSDTDGDPNVVSGNFAVHPGAHWTLQSEVKTAVSSPDGGAASLTRIDGSSKRATDLGPPVVLRMKKGDVVIAHQKLPHRGMPNFSPNIRYQCYFRIRHSRHAALRAEWLDDLMLPFEGTRAIMV